MQERVKALERSHSVRWRLLTLFSLRVIDRQFKPILNVQPAHRSLIALLMLGIIARILISIQAISET